MNSLIQSISSGGIAGVLVVFLLRNWISQRLKQSIKSEYDLKLETHKALLKKENDIYLAELNNRHVQMKQLLEHKLEIVRLERQIKYSGLYQEVVKTIKDIHAKLIEIQRAMKNYTSILEKAGEGSSKQELRKKVNHLIDEFWQLYNPQRIFLSESLDNDISNYVNTVRNKTTAFMKKVEQGGEEYEVSWVQIDDEVSKLWETVLLSIREQFREILGVNTHFPSEPSILDSLDSLLK